MGSKEFIAVLDKIVPRHAKGEDRPRSLRRRFDAHDWIRRIHGKWLRLSRDQFDTVHYAGIAAFKIGIILFNLVPLVVLFILG